MAKWRAVKRQGKSDYVDLEAVAAAIPHDTNQGVHAAAFCWRSQAYCRGQPKRLRRRRLILRNPVIHTEASLSVSRPPTRLAGASYDWGW